MSRIFFFFFNSHSPHTYSLRTNAATFNNQAWKRRERKTKQNKRNIIYNLTNELKIGSRPVYPVFFRHNLHSPNGRNGEKSSQCYPAQSDYTWSHTVGETISRRGIRVSGVNSRKQIVGKYVRAQR